MYTFQHRIYNKDLTFRKTYYLSEANAEQLKYIVNIFKEEMASGFTNEDRKPLHLCNFMIRRDGKLISYKELV